MNNKDPHADMICITTPALVPGVPDLQRWLSREQYDQEIAFHEHVAEIFAFAEANGFEKTISAWAKNPPPHPPHPFSK